MCSAPTAPEPSWRFRGMTRVTTSLPSSLTCRSNRCVRGWGGGAGGAPWPCQATVHDFATMFDLWSNMLGIGQAIAWGGVVYPSTSWCGTHHGAAGRHDAHITSHSAPLSQQHCVSHWFRRWWRPRGQTPAATEAAASPLPLALQRCLSLSRAWRCTAGAPAWSWMGWRHRQLRRRCVSWVVHVTGTGQGVGRVLELDGGPCGPGGSV